MPTVSVDVKQHFNRGYHTELWSYVKVEVAVLDSRAYGFCGCKATFNQPWLPHFVLHMSARHPRTLSRTSSSWLPHFHKSRRHAVLQRLNLTLHERICLSFDFLLPTDIKHVKSILALKSKNPSRLEIQT